MWGGETLRPRFLASSHLLCLSCSPPRSIPMLGRAMVAVVSQSLLPTVGHLCSSTGEQTGKVVWALVPRPGSCQLPELNYRFPLPRVLFAVPSFHRGIFVWGPQETRAGAERGGRFVNGGILFVSSGGRVRLGAGRCISAYVHKLEDCLPFIPRQGLPVGPGARLCTRDPREAHGPLPFRGQ